MATSEEGYLHWEDLWEAHKDHLADDCAHRLRQRGIAEPTQEKIYGLALISIRDNLAARGKTLADFGLPEPNAQLAADLQREQIRIIEEQLESDLPRAQEEVDTATPKLNADQLPNTSCLCNYNEQKTRANIATRRNCIAARGIFRWTTLCSFFRATSAENVHVLLGNDSYGAKGLMRNVVYTEALNQ
ncbi:hypothetical protein PsorP6_004617 [Peronosclerospora sorghi]|uniref:Uncharacterized protein n=1 Tax=Peronosclerospora sorghi TaxID=230839 RepID=A0ACC0VRR0_9STRA|nr:hypothetical protein PsorP6_004617 [Peronosclerospora sorghi]